MQSRPLDYFITEAEISKAARKLKNNKSAYSDKIRNEMIKASLPTLLPVYHKLFNTVLNLGTVPKNWCNGLITPIFKSGVRNDPSNYRGICVSSCLGKLFFSILNQRLLEHVTSLNILHKSQIGFLTKNRTSDHLLPLRTPSYRQLPTVTVKKYTLVLLTLEKPLNQSGMTDFYIDYYKLV